MTLTLIPCPPSRVARGGSIELNAEFGASLIAETTFARDWPERPIRIEVAEGSEVVCCYVTRADARVLGEALLEMVR